MGIRSFPCCEKGFVDGTLIRTEVPGGPKMIRKEPTSSLAFLSNVRRNPLLSVAHQPPLSWGFPDKVFLTFQVRCGLPFPFPGDLPDPGIKPVSTALAGRLFTAEPPGEPTISQNSLSSLCLLHPAVTPSRTPPLPSAAALLPTSDLRVATHSLRLAFVMEMSFICSFACFF